MAFPSRLLNDGEYVVVTTRAHSKALVGPVLVLLTTTFVATFAVGRAERELTSVPRNTILAGVVVLAMPVLLRGAVLPFLRWAGTTYTFTDRRFVARAGILARTGRTVPLDRVTGIDIELGILDRLLRCGTLVITDAAEGGRFELHDVPHVEEVQTRVSDQLHSLRQEPVTVAPNGRGWWDR